MGRTGSRYVFQCVCLMHVCLGRLMNKLALKSQNGLLWNSQVVPAGFCVTCSSCINLLSCLIPEMIEYLQVLVSCWRILTPPKAIPTSQHPAVTLNSVESVHSQASMAMAEHGIATRPAAFWFSSHRSLQEPRTDQWAFKWGDSAWCASYQLKQKYHCITFNRPYLPL